MFKTCFMEERYYCSPLGVSKTLKGWTTLVSFDVTDCPQALLQLLATVSGQMLITICRISQQL